MKNKFIITSTDSMQGVTVEKYYGLVSTQIAFDILKFFKTDYSVFKHLFRDSYAYKKHLDFIHKEAIDDLTRKAEELGANAILGLQIDFEEAVNPTWTQGLCWVCMVGTAVKVVRNPETSRHFFTPDSIPAYEIENEIKKRQIIQKIQSHRLPNKEEWIFLKEKPIPEILDTLLDFYVKAHHEYIPTTSQTSQELLFSNLQYYIGFLNKEEVIHIIYNKLNVQTQTLIELIKFNNLFAPEKVSQLINKENLGLVTELLTISKFQYTREDLLHMKQIYQTLTALPEYGEIKQGKNLLGKETWSYICPNGHKNSAKKEFCIECSKNIHNLTKKQIRIIDDFRERIEIVEEFLKET